MSKEINNLIYLKKHPLYIKKILKGKTLNLFGAPIPEEIITLYYKDFEKYLIGRADAT